MAIRNVVDDARELHPGVEGLWSHAEVTPARDESRRVLIDATKLSFSLQIVIVIVTATLTASGVVWLARSGQQELRSDVRDIKTAMEGFIKYQSSQIEELKRENEDQKRKEALDAVRIEEVRVIIAEIKGYMNAAGLMKGSGK